MTKIEINRGTHPRLSCLVIHFEYATAYGFIYLMDEQMSSVILTSHMYRTNTVQDDREGM